MKTNGLHTGGFLSRSRSQAPGFLSPSRTELHSTPWNGLSKEDRRLIHRMVINGFTAHIVELLTVLQAEKNVKTLNVWKLKKGLGLDEDETTCGGRPQRLALLDGGSSDFWPPRVLTAGGLASTLRPPFAVVAAAAAAWPLVPLQQGDKS